MFSIVAMNRQQAIDLYNGSVSDLAAALGYTSRHAVYMWPRDRPIPESAYLKLRYQLRPEAFDADGNFISSPAPTQQGEAA